MTDRNCIGIAVNFRLADSVRLCLIFCRIFPEKLADTGYVRAVSAQKCSCFKRAHAGFCHKVLRVYHHAGIHAVRFFALDPDSIARILQDFRYHFAGGRRIGFHIGKGRVFNRLRSGSVMIQNDDGFTDF